MLSVHTVVSNEVPVKSRFHPCEVCVRSSTGDGEAKSSLSFSAVM